MRISITTFSSHLVLVTAIFAQHNETWISQGRNMQRSAVSPNWAGAVMAAPPPNTIFSSVTGTFTVPYPMPPPGTQSPGTWYGAAWIGIDGFNYQATLFQAGVIWSVTRDSNGNISKSYYAFYEWVPNVSSPIDNFKISAGDTITIACSASSPTLGRCSIKNQSTKQGTSINMSAPNSAASLKGQSVEWIVEDIQNGAHTLIPLADFGTVEWTGCQAGTGLSKNPTLLTLSESTSLETLDIRQNSDWLHDEWLTSSTISDQTITVRYIGSGNLCSKVFGWWALVTVQAVVMEVLRWI